MHACMFTHSAYSHHVAGFLPQTYLNQMDGGWRVRNLMYHCPCGMVGGVETSCHTRLPSLNYAGSNVQPSVITHSLTAHVIDCDDKVLQ
jgi:hypothetical protein